MQLGLVNVWRVMHAQLLDPKLSHTARPLLVLVVTPRIHPAAVNDLVLPVPRANKKKRYSRSPSGQHSEQRAAEQQRVRVQRQGVGDAAGAAGAAGTAGTAGAPRTAGASSGSSEGSGGQLRRVSEKVARQGSAAQLTARSSSSRFSGRSGRLGERPGKSSPPLIPAAAGGGCAPRMPEQASGSSPARAAGTPAGADQDASGQAAAGPEPVGAAEVLGARPTMGRSGSPGLQRVSDHIGQLRQLAASPLDALRRKECQLHITATYLPLTEQELAVMAREAGRQQSGGGQAAMQRVSTLAASSPRITNLLHRWGFLSWLDSRMASQQVHWLCYELLRLPALLAQPFTISHLTPSAADYYTCTWIEHRTWPAARPKGSRATCPLRGRGTKGTIALGFWPAFLLVAASGGMPASAFGLSPSSTVALQEGQRAGGRHQEDNRARQGELILPNGPLLLWRLHVHAGASTKAAERVAASSPCASLFICARLPTACARPAFSCLSLQVSFRHRSNPVFDEMLELVLDGSLTRQPDLAIHVEVRCRSCRCCCFCYCIYRCRHALLNLKADEVPQAGIGLHEAAGYFAAWAAADLPWSLYPHCCCFHPLCQVWVQHFVLRDTFKGRVSIPLRQVHCRELARAGLVAPECSSGGIGSVPLCSAGYPHKSEREPRSYHSTIPPQVLERRRLRDTWTLEGVRQVQPALFSATSNAAAACDGCMHEAPHGQPGACSAHRRRWAMLRCHPEQQLYAAWPTCRDASHWSSAGSAFWPCEAAGLACSRLLRFWAARQRPLHSARQTLAQCRSVAFVLYPVR